MTEARTGTESTEPNRLLRLAGVLGVVFILTFIAQIFLVPQAPDYTARSGVILDYYAHHRAGIELGAWFTGIFAFLYGGFLAGLWGMLRRTAGAWLATLGLAAAVGNSTALFVGHAINVALATGVTGGSNAATVVPLFKVMSLLTMFFNTWMDGMAVLAFSLALLLSGLASGWMRWIAWIGLASGGAFVAAMLSIFDPAHPLLLVDLLAALTWVVWLVGLSVYLLRGGVSTARPEVASAVIRPAAS